MKNLYENVEKFLADGKDNFLTNRNEHGTTFCESLQQSVQQNALHRQHKHHDHHRQWKFYSRAIVNIARTTDGEMKFKERKCFDIGMTKQYCLQTLSIKRAQRSHPPANRSRYGRRQWERLLPSLYNMTELRAGQ